MNELRLPAVMELRVHGVHGTPPETMLGDPAPERVAGDDMARFFRRQTLISAEPSQGKARRWRGVEAFHWGRFTSGSPSRALWLAMVPFALLNLSRYALLLPSGKRSGLGRFADGVLRLLGVVLTLMLVTTVAYVSIEILMHQCADSEVCRADNRWLNYVAPRQFGPRLLIGAAPPLALVLLFWWFGRQSFLYEPRGSLDKWATPNGAFGDHAFWHTSPKAPILRGMHVAAACATLGLLFAAFLYRKAQEEDDLYTAWLEVGGLLLFVVLVVIAVGPEPCKLEADPRGRDPVKLPPYVTAIRWVCAGYLLLSGGVTAVALWPVDRVDAPLPGFEAAPNIEAVSAMVLLVALLITCWLLRRTEDGKRLLGTGDEKVPKAFRPLWKGYGAWVIAAVATALAVGFSGGLVFRIADFVGKPATVGKAVPVFVRDCDCCPEWSIQLGASYWTGALFWGALAALILLVLLPVAAAITRQYATLCVFSGGIAIGGATLIASSLDVGKVWVSVLTGAAVVVFVVGGYVWWRGWDSDGLAKLARADYGPNPDPRAIRRTTTTWRLALTKYRYHWGLTLVGVGGGAVVLACGVVAIMHIAQQRVPDLHFTLVSVATDIGAWVLSGLLSLLVLLGFRSWQGAKLRTAVGVLWDLVAFWPRLVHPICPPPYGGRAVLQTARRAHYLSKRCDAVVLSGHSQGSLVCAAAVSVLQEGKFPENADSKATLGKLGMVSYGSQLQWAYPRVFPAFLSYPGIRTLWADVLNTRWRNVYRWTDPLGGPVLAWPRTGTPWPGVQSWVGFPDPSVGLIRERVTAGDPYQADDGTLETAFGWRFGSDIRLRDPEFLTDSSDRPKSPLRGHGGYYDDPVFDVVVADLADVIRRLPPA